MAIKKIKMTIWTDSGMRSEMKCGAGGNGQDALDQLLIATGDCAAREKALAALQDCHQRMIERENERTKEAATNG